MKRKVAILGAGITGLALAFYLQKRFGEDIDITIFEAKDRVGGWLESVLHEGAVFERGPRSLRNSTQELEALISELDLDKELIFASSDAKRRYLVADGKLEALPHSFGSLFSSKLGRKALWASLREPFYARSQSPDESVASFFSRHIGKKATDLFISALCAGIYAACPEELSMRSCFPRFWEREKQHGSLVKAAFLSKKTPKSRTFTFRNGIETLPKRLAERLEAKILLNQRVEKVYEEGKRVHVVVDDTFEFDHLFSTISLTCIARLLSKEWLTAASTSIATVSIAFEEALLIPSGFGFLCPTAEDAILLGVVFDSILFPEQNGRFSTRLSFMMGGGRAPDICSFSDEVLLAYTKEFLQKYLGCSRQYDHQMIVRAPSAISRYPVGHYRTVEALEEEKGQITILGSGLHGVSVGESVTSAYGVAKKSFTA